MEFSDTPVLDAAQLLAIAKAAPLAGCDDCTALKCAGWEPMSVTFDEARLRRHGRLGRVDVEPEPTFAEYHPDGTRYWSVEAPIAIEFFPYNRCEVWSCRRCNRAFLRYTEYGGYYIEPRIRLLDPARIVPPTSA